VHGEAAAAHACVRDRVDPHVAVGRACGVPRVGHEQSVFVPVKGKAAVPWARGACTHVGFHRPGTACCAILFLTGKIIIEKKVVSLRCLLRGVRALDCVGAKNRKALTTQRQLEPPPQVVVFLLETMHFVPCFVPLDDCFVHLSLPCGLCINNVHLATAEPRESGFLCLREAWGDSAPPLFVLDAAAPQDVLRDELQEGRFIF